MLSRKLVPYWRWGVNPKIKAYAACRTDSFRNRALWFDSCEKTGTTITIWCDGSYSITAYGVAGLNPPRRLGRRKRRKMVRETMDRIRNWPTVSGGPGYSWS